MKRIYIDTSVVGGRFDLLFQEETVKFFLSVAVHNDILILSQLLEIEVSKAPAQVLQFLNLLKGGEHELVAITEEAISLADLYIQRKVVGRTSRADCLHIALATLVKADILVSWNFKHIVNLNRIKG